VRETIARKTSMAAFLHKLKREVASLGSAATHDKDYDDLKTRLGHLVEHTGLFKKGLERLSKAVTELNASNNGLDASLAGFFQASESGEGNPYAPFSGEVKKSAAALTKQEAETQKRIKESATKRIADLERAYDDLQKRCKDREEKRKEYDYYHSKITKINEDKAKSSKAETPSDAEKREQTEKKFEAATKLYNDVNTALVSDLKQLWNRRFELLAPVLAELFAVQRSFSKSYSQVFDEMKIPNVEPSAPLTFGGSAAASSGAAAPAAAASPAQPASPTSASGAPSK